MCFLLFSFFLTLISLLKFPLCFTWEKIHNCVLNNVYDELLKPFIRFISVYESIACLYQLQCWLFQFLVGLVTELFFCIIEFWRWYNSISYLIFFMLHVVPLLKGGLSMHAEFNAVSCDIIQHKCTFYLYCLLINRG